MVFVISTLLSGACSSGLKTTDFANPRFDFSFVQRVAVLQFENLTTDNQAGSRATRLMITELLATGAVDVVESGEVQAALARRPSDQFGRVRIPSTEDVVALGQDLGVQALVLGSVNQSEVLRSGQVGIPVVTLDVRMIETETGATVWAATDTEKGGAFTARFLGVGGQALSETTRLCVRELLRTLVE